MWDRLGGQGYPHPIPAHTPARESRDSPSHGDSCGILPSLTWLLGPSQPGWGVPQHHHPGGIPDDSDRAGLGELPGCHQGCPLLRQPQLGIPAAAAGIREDPAPGGEIPLDMVWRGFRAGKAPLHAAVCSSWVLGMPFITWGFGGLCVRTKKENLKRRSTSILCEGTSKSS